jgi:biopolymer transport protein ExbD
VTPLVDVTLVLLIVFMITVPAIVSSAPIKVDLPETSNTDMGPVEALPLNIYLRKDDTGEILLYFNETRTTESGLRALIDQAMIPGQEMPAMIASDKGIAYGEVVKIVDLLSSMGLHKIALDTKHVGGRR